ncbi:MAG TPA: hypothetical protein VD863_22825 [Bradyrhizobium sp.]|jgi:hypothetical protein|nr:hypothetical protein [Bradyrhizobium sp.]
MENEKDLASPNYGSTVSGVVGSVAMANAARTGPTWLRYFLYVCIAITVLLTGVGLVGKVGGIGSIPACDAQTTRDTLSDLNKQNKFSATKYNSIKKVSASDSETICTANLALSGGGSVEYDYRIFKEGSAVKVAITEIRR